MQDFLAPVKGIVSNFMPWMVCLAIQAKAAASTQSGSIPRLDVVSTEIFLKFALDAYAILFYMQNIYFRDF